MCVCVRCDWWMCFDATLDESQSADVAVVGLSPGKLFKVSVLPTDNSNVESAVAYVDKQVKSTCGCPRDQNSLRLTEATGAPTTVSLLQVRVASLPTVYCMPSRAILHRNAAKCILHGLIRRCARPALASTAKERRSLPTTWSTARMCASVRTPLLPSMTTCLLHQACMWAQCKHTVCGPSTSKDTTLGIAAALPVRTSPLLGRHRCVCMSVINAACTCHRILRNTDRRHCRELKLLRQAAD